MLHHASTHLGVVLWTETLHLCGLHSILLAINRSETYVLRLQQNLLAFVGGVSDDVCLWRKDRTTVGALACAAGAIVTVPQVLAIVCESLA